jgi:antitoxin ParD1/3/4
MTAASTDPVRQTGPASALQAGGAHGGAGRRGPGSGTRAATPGGDRRARQANRTWQQLPSRYAGAMSPMDIPPPDPVQELAEQQAAEKGYPASSEHARDLTRRNQARQQVRDLLAEGARSDPARPADASYFARLRASIRSGQ